jgi:hypothetical protein
VVSSALFGCGLNVTADLAKDHTPIPDRVIDAIAVDISAGSNGYSIGAAIVRGAR